MGAYHQFCPVAKAMELLDERWTLLIVRELVSGAERFNELRSGLPRISPTLLAERLGRLVRAGLVERADGGRYVLTPAGRELRPVVEAIGAWGIRWVGELAEGDLDPKLLMWDMHRHVRHDQVPDGRTVVQFTFRDAPAKQRRWWLVIVDGAADVCDHDPGFAVDVQVDTTLRSMVAVWLGELGWSTAVRTGALQVAGPQRLRRALPTWLELSDFAGVPRAATG